MANLLKLIPTIQSIGLVNSNIKRLKKKKKKTSDLIEQGTENLIGSAFISEGANFI